MPAQEFINHIPTKLFKEEKAFVTVPKNVFKLYDVTSQEVLDKLKAQHPDYIFEKHVQDVEGVPNLVISWRRRKR